MGARSDSQQLDTVKGRDETGLIKRSLMVFNLMTAALQHADGFGMDVL
jgi:hypothetical protein